MLPAPTTIATSTPRVADRRDLLGDPLDLAGVGAVVELAHQRLARELQQDAFELGVGGHLGREPIRPTRK